jgi:hypothetical protein
LLLVDRVASAAWRLRRLAAVEAHLFLRQGYEGEALSTGDASIRDAANADAFSRLCRYEATIERALYRALHELERIQARRAGHPVLPPSALDVSIDLVHGEVAAPAARNGFVLQKLPEEPSAWPPPPR